MDSDQESCEVKKKKSFLKYKAKKIGQHNPRKTHEIALHFIVAHMHTVVFV